MQRTSSAPPHPNPPANGYNHGYIYTSCGSKLHTYIETKTYLYMIPVRRSLPPPPPMVWSQNLRFAAFCIKTWYLQCSLHGGWLAPSANCNQPSENVLFAMFRLRHRGVVLLHPPLLRQCIIYGKPSNITLPSA